MSFQAAARGALGFALAWVVLTGAGAAESARATLARRYAELARSIRAEVLSPERSPFDPLSLVLSQGTDPERLARFVREKIAYEPYPGAVRGAAGTLAARAGSDWDRAVLLKAILERAGHRARLRATERSPREREAAVRAFREREAPSPCVLEPADPASPIVSAARPRFLEEAGIPERNRVVLAARAAAAARRSVAAAYDYAAAEAPWIEGLLRGAGEAIGRSWEAWREVLLSGAAERVAVEVLGEKGPVFLEIGPEAEPLGASLWEKARAFDDPPAEKTARFSVRVLVATGAKGSEKTLILERSFPLGELVEASVSLEVAPVDEKLARETPGLWDEAKWRKSVASFRAFQVVLRAGEAWAASKVFDLDGNVREVASDGRVEIAREAGAGIRRGLGGLFGGGEEGEAKGPGLEELVLELELALPGSKPARASRLLWGKLRSGVSPALSMDLLVLPSPLAPEAFAWIALRSLCENAPLVERVAASKDPSELRGLKAEEKVPAALHSWELARMGLVGTILARHPELAYLPGPSVVADTTQMVPGSEKRPVATRRAIDVIFERGAFFPRSAEAVSSAASSNLFLGVGATALEALALAEALPGLTPSGPCAESQAARLLGSRGAVRTAKGAGSAKPSALALWSIARNETGLVQVFPREEGPASWWSVDPATGFSLGRGETGEGQTAIEYLSVTNMNLNHLQCWLTFQKAVMYGGGGRLRADYAYVACVSGADNPFSYTGAYAGAKAIDSEVFEKVATANDGVQALVGIVNLLAGEEEEGEE